MLPTKTFKELEIKEYFTTGWVVYIKTGDRIALKVSSPFDIEYKHFGPEDIVSSWGNKRPSYEERLREFTELELPYIFLLGYTVNLTKYKKAKKIETLEGQIVRGNFFIPGYLIKDKDKN